MHGWPVIGKGQECQPDPRIVLETDARFAGILHQLQNRWPINDFVDEVQFAICKLLRNLVVVHYCERNPFNRRLDDTFLHQLSFDFRTIRIHRSFVFSLFFHKCISYPRPFKVWVQAEVAGYTVIIRKNIRPRANQGWLLYPDTGSIIVLRSSSAVKMGSCTL